MTTIDTTYTVHYTDINVTPITIQESAQDNSTDISLFGRMELEYGQALDQDVLQIFENFACPEVAGSTLISSNPDPVVNGGALSSPSQGQIWYNSTRQLLYFWNGVNWQPLTGRGQYSANWGQISDGSQIPQPINQYTGQSYPYSSCIWAVAPAAVPTAYSYMVCTTDNEANVTMKYRVYGESALTSGTANFLIISILGNTNSGTISVTPLTPNVSPSPTPTPTTSVQPSPTPTPTASISPSPSHTPAASPTRTPAASASPTPTPAPSVTRTPAPSNTPAPTVTPTPSPFANTCSQCTSIGFDCCVSMDSYLPDGRQARDVKVGDELFLAHERTLEPFKDVVTYSEPSLQDSLLLITENGVELECSKTAPIPTKRGVLKAPDVLGEYAATNVDGVVGWSKVVKVIDIGKIWVQHITVNNNSFWAGKNRGNYMLHHNIKACTLNPTIKCIWIQPNCCDCVVP